MQDLVIDSLVEKLEGIIIKYINGPPKAGQNLPLKIRAGLIEHSKDTVLRGSFIISPGRTEYIEKYAETIIALNQRGFNCLIIDHRGQGLSDRIGKEYWHGDIDQFEKSAEHLGLAIKEFDSQLPHPRFMLSHSMGGMIVLLGLIDNDFGAIDGAIYNAPMWGLKPTPFAKQLANGLCRIGLGAKTAPTLNVKWSPNNYFNNDVSNDQRRFARNNAIMLCEPRLQLGGPTNNWVNASFAAFKRFNKENIGKITMPSLIFQAGNESLVDNQAQNMVAGFMPNATIKIMENAKHEMLVEREDIRTLVWHEIDNFLEKWAFK